MHLNLSIMGRFIFKLDEASPALLELVKECNVTEEELLRYKASIKESISKLENFVNTRVLQHVIGDRLYPEICERKVLAPEYHNFGCIGWESFYENLAKKVLPHDIEVKILTTLEHFDGYLGWDTYGARCARPQDYARITLSAKGITEELDYVTKYTSKHSLLYCYAHGLDCSVKRLLSDDWGLWPEHAYYECLYDFVEKLIKDIDIPVESVKFLETKNERQNVCLGKCQYAYLGK